MTTARTTPAFSLYPHQQEAVAFLERRKGIGGLWLEPRLGKTRACLAFLHQRARRILVVGPLSGAFIWQREPERVGLDLPVLLAVDGGVKDRAARLRTFTDGLAFVSYSAYWRSPLREAIFAWHPDAVILDECVPAGTHIATPNGDRPIEELAVGDVVLGYDHATGHVRPTVIKTTFKRRTVAPLQSVATVMTTPAHPVWTEEDGYIPAARFDRRRHTLVQLVGEHHAPSVRRLRQNVQDISQSSDSTLLRSSMPTGIPLTALGSQARSGTEALRMVPRASRPEPDAEPLLQPNVLSEMENVASGVCKDFGYTEKARSRIASDAQLLGEGWIGKDVGIPQVGAQSVQEYESARTDARKDDYRQGDRYSAFSRWEWARANDSRTVASMPIAMGIECCCADKGETWSWHANMLQGRCSTHDSENRCRDRRLEPYTIVSEGCRSQEDSTVRTIGMDNCPIHERGSVEYYGHRGTDLLTDFGIEVFNIETETNNYFANGILVHNCQAIKGRTSRQAKMAHLLADVPGVRYRIGLSGTPMTQGLEDFFSIYRFIDPSVLGRSWSAFEQRYLIYSAWTQFPLITGYRDKDDLHQRIAATSIRITEADAFPDRKPVVEEEVPVTLTDASRRRYAQFKREAIAEIDGLADDGKPATGLALARIALTTTLRLQQLTSGFIVTDAGPIDVSAEKLDTCEDLVHQSRAQGLPVVIFCRFRRDIARIAARLHIPLDETISGTTPVIRRNQLIEQFQAGQRDVLIGQIQSIATSIELSAGRVAIFYSLGFKLSELEQAKFRLRGPNQHHAVILYYLVVPNTVDRKVLDALQAKQQLAARMIDRDFVRDFLGADDDAE